MGSEEDGVAVCCRSISSLIGFSTRLNALGYYRIILCDSVSEVIGLLEAGRKFRALIFDDFELDVHGEIINDIAWFRGVKKIIVISDVNTRQRLDIFRWAKNLKLPLHAVLQAPLRDHELALALE